MIKSAWNSSNVSNSLRKLGSKNLQFFNGRRRGQEIWCICEECLGNGPVEMSLSSRLIPKCIEDGERGWPQPQREPQRSGRLLICHLKALLQESDNFLLFPWFCFQSYKQSK